MFTSAVNITVVAKKSEFSVLPNVFANGHPRSVSESTADIVTCQSNADSGKKNLKKTPVYLQYVDKVELSSDYSASLAFPVGRGYTLIADKL